MGSEFLTVFGTRFENYLTDIVQHVFQGAEHDSDITHFDHISLHLVSLGVGCVRLHSMCSRYIVYTDLVNVCVQFGCMFLDVLNMTHSKTSVLLNCISQRT